MKIGLRLPQGASPLRIFHASTASFKDFLLYSGKFSTPSRQSEYIILPLISHIVTNLILWSIFMKA
jgi:hypothetical protein